MRKLPLIAGAALAVAGAAIAARPQSHELDVALADGTAVHVVYVGDVAPKVTLAPGRMAGRWAAPGLPAFAGFDRMIEEMNRRTEALVRQAQEMARQPTAVPGVNVAAYANAPVGSTSTRMVSVSSGGSHCTRTTETVAQGAGKPPKVTTSVSGNCGPGAPAAP